MVILGRHATRAGSGRAMNHSSRLRRPEGRLGHLRHMQRHHDVSDLAFTQQLYEFRIRYWIYMASVLEPA